MPQLPQINRDVLQSIDLLTIWINLLLSLVLASVLAWHYVRYAHALSDRRRFSRVFVLIASTTTLIITVVKSSLALSLGLIGALSIIRFRTPIKEPEELAYLFLAIAIGVGLGADQLLPTLVVFVTILVFLALRARPQHETPQQTILEVSTGADTQSDAAGVLDVLLPAVQDVCPAVDLRRVDQHEGQAHVFLMVELASADAATRLLRAIEAALPGAAVSLIDREQA